jgi:hypothetical protein
MLKIVFTTRKKSNPYIFVKNLRVKILKPQPKKESAPAKLNPCIYLYPISRCSMIAGSPENKESIFCRN